MFENHGFCLLRNPSRVKHWNEDFLRFAFNDLKNNYWPEIELLLKEHIFPHKKICDLD